MELTKQNSYLKEYVLKCPICYELFSNFYKPLIIPCGHTICSSCVDNLKKISADDYDEEYSSEINDENFDLSMDSEEEEENTEQSVVSEENDGSDEGTSESSEESEEENGENIENEIVEENLNAPEINLDHLHIGNFMGQNLNTEIPSNEFSLIAKEKNKKIKIKCSICRKRMKIFERDILVNMSVIKVVDHINQNETEGNKKDFYFESNSEEINTHEKNIVVPTLKEEKLQLRDKIIFCKICSFVDTENNHLNSREEARNHKEHFAFLDDNQFMKIKNFYLDSSNLNKKYNNDEINLKEIEIREIRSKSKSNEDEIYNGIISDYMNNHTIPSTPSKFDKLFSKDEDNKKIKRFSQNCNLNSINDLILGSFQLFFETLKKSNEFTNIAKFYIKNYFMINSKAGYLKNKSFKKLTDLYEKFNQTIKELENQSDVSSEKAILQRAENIIEAAEVLCEKYSKILENYLKNYEKLNISAKPDDIKNNRHSNVTNNYSNCDLKIIIDKIIKIKALKLLKEEFMHSYWNNLLEFERRYAVLSHKGSNQILIFDLRVQNELEVNYEKVFDEIKNERNLSEEELEKFFTEHVEVDEDGRYLYLIGKRNKPSKSFRCYDLLERKLENKKNLPKKFSMVGKYYYKNKLFIFGGSTENDNISNNCYYYDVEADWWEELPSLNIRRTTKSIAVFEDKFYVFGGSSSLDTEDLLTFEVLDLNKMGTGEIYFKWQSFKVKGYNTPVNLMLYGFIEKNKLVIVGGEESSYYEESLRGCLIYLSDKEEEIKVIEEFKIKMGMINTYSPCSTLRGLIVGSQSLNDYFTKFDMKNNLGKLKQHLYI